MRTFKDKYISEAENAVTPDAKKILISNDAFAIGEMMEALIKIIDKTRVSLG